MNAKTEIVIHGTNNRRVLAARVFSRGDAEAWTMHAVFRTSEIKRICSSSMLRDCIADSFSHGSGGAGCSFARRASVHKILNGRFIVISQSGGLDI